MEGYWIKNFSNFRKKVHKIFLHQEYLWKHPKFKSGNPPSVIYNHEQQSQILSKSYMTRNGLDIEEFRWHLLKSRKDIGVVGPGSTMK